MFAPETALLVVDVQNHSDIAPLERLRLAIIF
jgi:hypothetical protein